VQNSAQKLEKNSSGNQKSQSKSGERKLWVSPRDVFSLHRCANRELKQKISSQTFVPKKRRRSSEARLRTARQRRVCCGLARAGGRAGGQVVWAAVFFLAKSRQKAKLKIKISKKN
jgi:hypothetical protein